MKKIIYTLLLLVILSTNTFGQGAVPSPTFFEELSGALKNISTDSLVLVDSGGDTILVAKDGLIRMLDSLNVIGDIVTNNLFGDYIHATYNLYANSLLAENTGVLSIVGPRDFNTAIQGGLSGNLLFYDNTDLQWTMTGAHLLGNTNTYITAYAYYLNSDTSTAALSLKGKGYIDNHLAGDSLVTSGVSDGQVLKWSVSNNRWQPGTDAGASAGTGDTVIFNDGSVEYSNIGDLIKVLEGNGIDIIREDSSTYDIIRLAIAVSWLSSYIDTTSVTIQRADTATVADSLLDLDEKVSDLVGAMVTTNTETGITVTYEDYDNTLDFNVILGSTIETSEITNGTILFEDIAQNGATSGQVMAWNGSAWAAADQSGSSGGGYWEKVNDSTYCLIDSVSSDTVMTLAKSYLERLLIKTGYKSIDFEDTIGVSYIVPSAYDFSGGTLQIIGSTAAGVTWKVNTTTYMNLSGGLLSAYNGLALNNFTIGTSNTVAYADSSGSLTDGSVDLADIAQNGASTGQVMKWSGSGWALGSDLTGSGFWDTIPGYSGNWVAALNTAGDTLVQVYMNGDSVMIFGADGKTLMFGSPGSPTVIDTLVTGADTIVDFTGIGLALINGSLVVDTAWFNTNFKIATASVADSSVVAGNSHDVDSTGTEISTALGGRVETDGDTLTGTYDFSGGVLTDILTLSATNYYVTTGEFFFWESGATRFNFSDDIYSNSTITANNGGFFSANSNFFSNSAGTGASSGAYGLYVYNGSQTGAYMLHNASNNHWRISHKLYVSDTTTTDSLVATHHYADSVSTNLDSTKITDGGLSEDDMNFRFEWIYLEDVYSFDHALEDSIYLTAGVTGANGDTLMLLVDSAGNITANDQDTVTVSGNLPFICTVDSIEVLYMTGAEIVDYYLMGNDVSSGFNLVDSIYESYTTDLTSATWTIQGLGITNDITAAAGDRIGFKYIVNFGADNERLRIGWVRVRVKR